VRRELVTLFDPALGGFEPGGVSTGHMEGSAHYEGRAIDVFVRPVSPANKVRGWAIAQYLVAQADRLHLQTVIFDGRNIYDPIPLRQLGFTYYSVGRPAATPAVPAAPSTPPARKIKK